MLFCGLDLFAPVPDATTHCHFRNALMQGGVHDDLLAGVCRQIKDHGPKRRPRQSTRRSRRAFQCRHASAIGQERPEAYAGRQDDIQRLCPAGRGPNEESFIDKVYTGTCEPGRVPPRLIP